MRLFICACAILLSFSTLSYAGRKPAVESKSFTSHELCMSRYNDNAALCQCAMEKVYTPMAQIVRDSMIKVNENLIVNQQARLTQILSDPNIDEGALTEMCAPRKELAAFYEAHPFDLSLPKEEKQKVKTLRYNKAKEIEAIIQKVDAKYLTHTTKTQLSGSKDCDPRDVIARLEQERAEIEKSFQDQTLKVGTGAFQNGIRNSCQDLIK